jgi:hypothetical protein
MNKPLVAMSFIVLIIVGFLLGYVLGYVFRVTHLVWQSSVIMAAYYVALIHVMIQFMDKPRH